MQLTNPSIPTTSATPRYPLLHWQQPIHWVDVQMFSRYDSKPFCDLPILESLGETWGKEELLSKIKLEINNAEKVIIYIYIDIDIFKQSGKRWVFLKTTRLHCSFTLNGRIYVSSIWIICLQDDLKREDHVSLFDHLHLIATVIQLMDKILHQLGWTKFLQLMNGMFFMPYI